MKAKGHSRSLGPVAPVVDGRRDGDHYGWEEVSGCVIVLPARELALEDLDEHDIQLHAFQTHPSERSQEKEMKNPGYNRAHDLRDDKENIQKMTRGTLFAGNIRRLPRRRMCKS